MQQRVKELVVGFAVLLFFVGAPIAVLGIMCSMIPPHLALTSPCHRGLVTLVGQTLGQTNGTTCLVNDGHPGQLVLPGNTYPMHICAHDCYTSPYIHSVHDNNEHRIMIIVGACMYSVCLFLFYARLIHHIWFSDKRFCPPLHDDPSPVPVPVPVPLDDLV